MATKDKIVNLEDLKVLSDHVEGEVTDLKSELSEVYDELGVKMFNIPLANGTPPNDGNANAVCTSDFIPVKQSDVVTILDNIPLKSSSNVRGFAFYVYASNKTSRVEEYSTKGLTENKYTVTASNAAYVKWAIWEYDASENYVPLRIGNLADKTALIKVADSETLSKVSNSTSSALQEYGVVLKNALEWQRGTVYQGEFVNLLYRITSKITKVETSVRLKAKAGFLVFVVYYDDGKQSVVESVDTSADIVIEPNRYFRIIIRRETEITSETANISEFSSNIRFEFPVLQTVENLEKINNDKLIPFLRNGSAGNDGNAYSISTQYIIPLRNVDALKIQYLGDTTDDDEFVFSYCLFKGSSDGMTSNDAFIDNTVQKFNVNSVLESAKRQTEKYVVLPNSVLLGYDHIMVYLWRFTNGELNALRISTDQYNILIQMVEDSNTQDDINNLLVQARHVKGNVVEPFTLLHFSDIHADANALTRIMKSAKKYSEYIADSICTGDIVSNSGESIASWWDSSVLTCIGNHDSATYDSTNGYNWVALSMAQRDSLYISPFKSNWGDVVHTSGRSYYYKDYTTEKIRLIVMDIMLYSEFESDTSLATAQTAWLSNLLSDAISKQLHVIIAIHAPHGGAEPIDCSFSKVGETTMPTRTDCNTPQSVIDAVATAINNGLHFVGYIVGHTHQDNVWDAENDGTQLMYCITCASTNYAPQWYNSDQFRSSEFDAFNIITVDTANTLVKIIRGGGADMDDHMRTRKAICFNYSTGEMVGEVL